VKKGETRFDRGAWGSKKIIDSECGGERAHNDPGKKNSGADIPKQETSRKKTQALREVFCTVLAGAGSGLPGKFVFQNAERLGSQTLLDWFGVAPKGRAFESAIPGSKNGSPADGFDSCW